MENALAGKLDALDDGYRAATWKHDLVTSGVVSRTAYAAWLLTQPHNSQAEHDRVKAAQFLGNHDTSEAKTLHEAKTRAVLRDYAPITWAVRVIMGDTIPPTDPRLQKHVAWVATFITPTASFSL